MEECFGAVILTDIILISAVGIISNSTYVIVTSEGKRMWLGSVWKDNGGQFPRLGEKQRWKLLSKPQDEHKENHT